MERLNDGDVEGLRIGVVGATGAVGTDLIETLGEGPVSVGEWRLIARASSTPSSIEINGRAHRVHPLPAEPTRTALFEGLDLLVFATPAETTRRWLPQARAQEVTSIDIGGALFPSQPLVVPPVSMEPLDQTGVGDGISTPSAPAVMISAVLAPFLDLGFVSATGTVFLSASSAGQKGTAELSQQVVSLFNGGSADRAVFPKGIAFDLDPQMGPTEHGWCAGELRMSGEVGAVLGVDPRRLRFTQVMAPLFAGMGVQLHIRTEHADDIEEMARRLEEAPFVKLVDPMPGPKALIGQPVCFVGRLRPDPMGEGFHLMVMADNLRFGASANVLATILCLRGKGLL